MNVQRVLELIDLVDEVDIAELTVSDDGGEILVALGATTSQGSEPVARMAPRTQARSISTSIPAGASPVLAGADAEVGRNEADAPAAAAEHRIRAPMIGAFHRSAKAGGVPLVEIGDRVDRGTPLCVIEAMKMMNEIEADCAGRITRIWCEEGQAVEPDQPLFTVEREAP